MDEKPADEQEIRLVCNMCGLKLEPMKTQFSYLGHSFHTDIPRCPGCGQAFIPEKLAKGRMSEVETSLEDK
jgi:hypothetical protein